MYMRTYASYGPKNIKSSQKDPIKPKETGPPVLHPDTQPMYPSYPFLPYIQGSNAPYLTMTQIRSHQSRRNRREGPGSKRSLAKGRSHDETPETVWSWF